MTAPDTPLPTAGRPGDRAPRERLTIDVSLLPETAFGHRAMTWWATAGFMLVEGTTLAVVLTSYLYLRLNAAAWPPRPASAPELLATTVSLAALLLKIVPSELARRAALRLDGGAVRTMLVVMTAFSVLCAALRWWELQSLNVRWDTNAYGSALWAVYVAHTLLLATDVLESAAITAIFFRGPVETKHYSDVEDAAVYQYFLSLSWALLYLVVVLGPRVL